MDTLTLANVGMEGQGDRGAMGGGDSGNVKRRGRCDREETSHQKFSLLFPVVALGVCGHVCLSDHTDEIPLLLRGFQAVPHRLLQLFFPTALPVLLDQLPLGQPLAVVQDQVGCHANCDALLEATFLALVPGYFVDYAFPLVLTCIGRVEILLDSTPEETLAPFTGDTAIMITSSFVSAHYTKLILVQVTWYVPILHGLMFPVGGAIVCWL